MTYDVIVVGSGLLGAVCVRNLAEQGLQVLLLEAGSIISEPAGDHLRNQNTYRNHPDQFFYEINRWCQQFDAKTLPAGLPGANVTHAYGGQGLLWTNNCPRLVPHEYWPEFDEMNMNHLYQRAERMLHVSEHLFDHSILQHKLLALLSPKLNIQNRKIAKVPLAAKYNDKSEIVFTALKQIFETPESILRRIKIQVNTHVIELLHKRATVSGIKVEQGNKIIEIKAKAVVVAAGAFDTTQLLYDSNIRPEALGKYLHFHPLHLAQVILDQSLRSHPDALPRICIYPTPDYPWHAMILRDIFPDIGKEAVDDDALIDLQFFVPMDVQAGNRMILSEGKPKFDVRLTDSDKKIIKRAMQDLHEIAAQLGQYRQGCEPFTLDFGFTHPMGMCRLGHDPKTSVTNLKGQVHGINNLYLASVGLLPTKIAVNPTLTAAALALGSTDYLVHSI